MTNGATKCSVFDQLAQNEHEQIIYGHDKATGLQAIIAIHNTALGPALGGTRFWDYASDGDALTDVLRLSKGMTYKAALAGLKVGGGKAVIMGDPKQAKTPDLLGKYGQLVDTLHGRYITAPDVNTTMYDMVDIARETTHVYALPSAQGGSDDPSPFTAYSTYLGIKAAVKKVYGDDSLEGKKIGVEGIGKVGKYLVDHLRKENAQVYVTDIAQDPLKAIAQQHSVQVATPEEFHDLPMDIYAPCALGATLNDANIARLRCKIVAGAANNQLADEQRHSQLLLDRGIIYAPDYMVNSGGLINIYTEIFGTYSQEQAYKNIEPVYEISLEVLNQAEKHQLSPATIAQKLAEQNIKNASNA